MHWLVNMSIEKNIKYIWQFKNAFTTNQLFHTLKFKKSYFLSQLKFLLQFHII